ncbi:uncharacterized protein Z520_02672 [Fonsecaea multimorphosa CBS 102226]|uniref:Sulfatase N-terminal domain-containing protein n=1 Tax=Fonsecaea multimorphosa CBS 102226 TaxID=1442371 RepID=A0A0D2KD36_9EURO|nr:uncharacterized protein Z520_02672 [Fonsecaea multimorphosa CBS 102226]KIY01120.1 hypothetical protein Z520_02672 [Fonsecaea multimorphosa CBS 102226]OAL28741.1 hypothetical protein AYO22_02606 [Fonsecaea multimorphosa]
MGSPPSPNRRPNILFILADDHASKAISCYGHNINHTPNLDRIAANGVRFNHCYVTNSICTPSRASILTGTYNHTNDVLTLYSKINNRQPNVAKQLRAYGDYQTAMIGKWHLGEGPGAEPTGFDYWSVLPEQGEYWDPEFIEPPKSKASWGQGTHNEPGYATDIITNKTLDFIKNRDPSRPFFVMCHHKAPHRSWECDHKHRDLYTDPIRVPDTFTDDYKNRARAAKVAKNKIADDMTFFDLGLVQPEGGIGTNPATADVGEKEGPEYWSRNVRRVPFPATDVEVQKMRPLIDKETGEKFTFKTRSELAEFKFQRYMQRYLRTIQSIDDNVGRLLDYLETDRELHKNTVVIYSSDQGFFLGEHGWFDKRFMYEESFQMPFLIQYPALINGQRQGSVCNHLLSNVDFAPTFLDLAGLRTPTYMQGISFGALLRAEEVVEAEGSGKEIHHGQWSQDVVYHRYWMHRDAVHEAYAHYGCRDQRYKLIYWYNEGFDIEGTREGGQDKEWELFDTDQDPLELFNVYADPHYREIVARMTRLLEEKMEEIGDLIVHPRAKLE